MRYPRPRVRVRTAVIAVAICGLALGLIAMAHRRERFQRIAAQHRFAGMMLTTGSGSASRAEVMVALAIDEAAREGRSIDEAVDQAKVQAARDQRRGAFHNAMAQKYERAARYPWLRVPADPPEPE